MAHASPVPTHTILGSEGATARAPIAATGSLSKIGVQRLPPSVDFHTPPDAPAYQVSGSPGTPATAATRFPTAGPRKRNPYTPPGPPRPRRCANNEPGIRIKHRRHRASRLETAQGVNIFRSLRTDGMKAGMIVHQMKYNMAHSR